MASIKETAQQFFDACETGKGWAGCRQFCHPAATFSAQAGALASVTTLEGYTDWMKGLFTPVPDGSYELRSFAVDDGRNSVLAYAVFRFFIEFVRGNTEMVLGLSGSQLTVLPGVVALLVYFSRRRHRYRAATVDVAVA